MNLFRKEGRGLGQAYGMLFMRVCQIQTNGLSAATLQSCASRTYVQYEGLERGNPFGTLNFSGAEMPVDDER